MRKRDMPQLMLRIKPEVKAWLKSKGEELERSQSWLVAKALDEAMERDAKNSGA